MVGQDSSRTCGPSCRRASFHTYLVCKSGVWNHVLASAFLSHLVQVRFKPNHATNHVPAWKDGLLLSSLAFSRTTWTSGKGTPRTPVDLILLTVLRRISPDVSGISPMVTMWDTSYNGSELHFVSSPCLPRWVPPIQACS